MSDDVRILDITDEEYFALPSLDQSQLKQFLRNPADWAYERINGGGEPTSAMKFGTAFHAFLLGTGEIVNLPEGETLRSKANKEWADEQQAEGRIVVTFEDMQTLKRMKRNIELTSMRDDMPDYMDIIRTGVREQAIEWRDKTTGLWLKAKPDLIPVHGDYLVDLKTARAADTDSFARTSLDHGYHIQAEFYRQAVAKCPKKAFGRNVRVPTAMQFWVFEKTNACDWQPFTISSDSRIAGMARDSIRQALNGIAKMVELGERAGYGEGVTAAVQWCVRTGYGSVALDDGTSMFVGYDKRPKELAFTDWMLSKAMEL